MVLARRTQKSNARRVSFCVCYCGYHIDVQKHVSFARFRIYLLRKRGHSGILLAMQLVKRGIKN